MKKFSIYFATLVSVVIFSSCTKDFVEDFEEDFPPVNVDGTLTEGEEEVVVSVSYNLSTKSVYSSSMTRSGSYTDDGDTVWTNTFKPLIENGSLVDSTMNITFTSLKNGLTTNVKCKFGQPIILKKGKYAVAGYVGEKWGYANNGNHFNEKMFKRASLEVCDTISITEQNQNIILKSEVKHQALIISPNKFTVAGTNIYQTNGYYYIFLSTLNGTEDNRSYSIEFDNITYTFKPIHNNFYYYGDSDSETNYDVTMDNGHK